MSRKCDDILCAVTVNLCIILQKFVQLVRQRSTQALNSRAHTQHYGSRRREVQTYSTMDDIHAAFTKAKENFAERIPLRSFNLLYPLIVSFGFTSIQFTHAFVVIRAAPRHPCCRFSLSPSLCLIARCTPIPCTCRSVRERCTNL